MLKLSIYKTGDEWSLLHKYMQDKKLTSLSHLLFVEINKKYAKLCVPCMFDDPVKKVRVSVEIDVPSEIQQAVECHALSLGIQPATLISKMFIDSILYERNK